MIATNHIDPEDLALHAMQLLTDSEAERVQAHLDECSGCREDLALMRGDLALLALTSDVHSPPASSRQRLMTQVYREKKIVPIDRPINAEAGSPLATRLLVDDVSSPELNRAPRILPWVSWVGWAVAAALTVTAADLYRERDELRDAVARQAGIMASLESDAQKGRALITALSDQDAMRVTLTQTPAKAAPQGRAAYLPEKGSLVFTASNLEPLQPFKTYELWLIPADGTAPVPAGTFLPDARGNAALILPEIPKGLVAKAFGVTIEAEGGADKPTMPIVLSGA